MRKITVDCRLCGARVALERAKELLFEVDRNSYHLMDVCSDCLDSQLKRAESVNDTNGYRQTAAALVRLPDNEIPAPG